MLRVQRVALLSILLVAWLAVPAHAAFPGQNGRLVLGEFNTPISTINPNGTDLRTVPVALPPNTSLISRVRWSPDGTKLLLTTASKPNGCLLKASAYNIRVVNADGTGLRNVTQPSCVNGAGIHDQQADWSPDGRRIVFVSNRQNPGDGCGTFSCGLRIWVAFADGSGGPRRVSPVSTAFEDDLHPEFSPDAGRVLFEHANAAGDGDLRLVNADGTGPAALTSGPADDRDPDWSPDGTQVVFSSDRDTPSSCTAVAEPRCDHEIYKINATGTGLTRLTNHAGEDSHPVFSPDGHKIAWEGEGPQHIEFNRQHDLFVMNTNGTQQTNITDASRPNSPDFNNQGSADALNRLYIRPDWQPLQTVPPAMPAPAMRVFIDNVNMRSGDAANTGTIYLSARAPAGGTVVSLSSNSAAAAVPPSVTIPAGAQQASFPIAVGPVTADATPVITATIPGRTQSGSFRIFAPPATVDLLFPQTTVVGGDTVTGNVQFNVPNGPAAQTVTLDSSDTTLATVPASVTIPAQVSGTTVDVTTKRVTTTRTVTITAHFNGGSTSVTLTLTPPATDLVSISFNPATVATGDATSGSVTLTNPAPPGGVVVHVTSDDPAIPFNTDLSISEGNTGAGGTTVAQQVTVPTTVHVTATLQGLSKTATVTVLPAIPAAISSLTLSPASVKAGDTATGTITLDRPAGTAGLAFFITSDGPNASAAAGTVVVPAGGTTGQFTIVTNGVGVNAPTPVVFTATSSSATGGTKTATLTVNPLPPPPADTVRVTRADYDSAKRELRVEATSTSATATLTAFVDSTGARIGQLTNSGGGTYKGQFANVANPGVVRVTSSLGGSATLAVSAATGTVRPAPVTAVAPSAKAPAVAPKRLEITQLHATGEIALPAADPRDATAPAIGRLRLLPDHFRAGSPRGTLVSLTLSEAARVTLAFARVRGDALVPVRERMVRTLPGRRVRIRFNGVLDSGRRLPPGRYRVLVIAVDAAGHRSRAARAVFVVRP